MLWGENERRTFSFTYDAPSGSVRRDAVLCATDVVWLVQVPVGVRLGRGIKPPGSLDVKRAVAQPAEDVRLLVLPI